MSTNYGKLNFSISFDPTSAFPIDARSYFEDYNSALAAAQTAKPAGSSESKYYYGQLIIVASNLNTIETKIDLYYIKQVRDGSEYTGTLEPIASNTNGGGTGNSVNEIYIGDNEPSDPNILLWVTSDGSIMKFRYNASWIDITMPAGDSYSFKEDLIATMQFGKYKPDAITGNVTIPTKNKNIEDVINDAFSVEEYPDIQQPIVTIESPECKPYEVGTVVAPTYQVAFTNGKYSFDADTGVTLTGYQVVFNGKTLTTDNGQFEEVTVTDSTNLKCSVTATFTEGILAHTNIGKETELKIEAGDVIGETALAVAGYRNTFFGTTEDKGVLNSDSIRALGGRSDRGFRNSEVFDLPIPIGAYRIIIAYPGNLRDLTSVIDVNGMSANITSSFKSSTIPVAGFNGYSPINYKVYTLTYAVPTTKVNTYRITI